MSGPHAEKTMMISALADFFFYQILYSSQNYFFIMKKEIRPWGYFVDFSQEIKGKKLGWVKILFVKKNAELSHQYHKLRDELWFVIKGKIKVKLWENVEEYPENLKKIELREGERVFIPKLCVHTCIGIEDSFILEFGFGECKEEDIIRLHDKYGRV